MTVLIVCCGLGRWSLIPRAVSFGRRVDKRRIRKAGARAGTGISGVEHGDAGMSSGLHAYKYPFCVLR